MKRHAPATLRNRAFILEVLRDVLAGRRDVLEIASGSGEHAVHFAAGLPHVRWQPSDPDPDAILSIEAHREDASLSNLLAAIRLDVTEEPWGTSRSRPDSPPPAGPIFGDRADAVVCINMIHIAPWRAAEGLFRGAARVLSEGSPLYLYGPFRFSGAFTAPSNEAFDASLRGRDPAWGVRDLDDVTALAAEHGFARVEVISMPANNHSVVFRRARQG